MAEEVLKICDECERRVLKFHRIHNGRHYCETCYKRVFKKQICPKCGKLARLPIITSGSVCKKCESSGSCIRCGKESYKIGKITIYGPVCNYCSTYFREQKPCDECGNLSSRLTKVSRKGHNKKLCQKCACADYSTCPACQRYRQLIPTTGGQLLCKKCAELGKIPCSKCGTRIPAGRGQQCEACYWEATFQKRVKIDLAAISSTELQKGFSKFSEWLQSSVGTQKAALTINRYFQFFFEIDEKWSAFPSSNELLLHFGTARLRKFQLPMRWLAEAKNLVLDKQAKEQDSERRRIQKAMEAAPSSLARHILNEYKQRLEERQQTVSGSLRSIRLSLCPAMNLFLTDNASREELPTQKMLDEYLIKKPGQKAAITGFINYLNKIYDTKLIIRIDKNKTKQRRRKELEKKMESIIKLDEYNEITEQKWIITCLEYFHKRKVSKKLFKKAKVTKKQEGLYIEINNDLHYIPYTKSVYENKSVEQNKAESIKENLLTEYPRIIKFTCIESN